MPTYPSSLKAILMGLFRKEVEVYVINDHEVVKKYIHDDWRWFCRRCETARMNREVFSSIDCHECNCDHCNR